MRPTTASLGAGQNCICWNVLLYEFLRVFAVDIDNGVMATRDADIAIRILCPPRIDLIDIATGTEAAALDAIMWVFAWTATIFAAKTMVVTIDAVTWQYWPTQLTGICDCSCVFVLDVEIAYHKSRLHCFHVEEKRRAAAPHSGRLFARFDYEADSP